MPQFVNLLGETFTENGDTAEWWPCFIVDVFDDGTVRVECENGTYDVNAEDVRNNKYGKFCT